MKKTMKVHLWSFTLYSKTMKVHLWRITSYSKTMKPHLWRITSYSKTMKLHLWSFTSYSKTMNSYSNLEGGLYKNYPSLGNLKYFVVMELKSSPPSDENNQATFNEEKTCYHHEFTKTARFDWLLWTSLCVSPGPTLCKKRYLKEEKRLITMSLRNQQSGETWRKVRRKQSKRANFVNSLW